MSLSVGIVGLPNVGKSTLFNALLKKQQAYVANFPFATIEPNVGVVPVPDERLVQLAEVIANQSSVLSSRLSDKSLSVIQLTGRPKTGKLESENGQQKTDNRIPPLVPATVKFLDIAGLISGASKGEGLGNKFLSHIRECDAICHVVRLFSDANIIKAGSLDPKSDFETVKTELDLADLEMEQKHKEKKKKNEEEVELSLFTKKPILVVLNVDEKELACAQGLEKKWASELGVKEEQVIVVCAKTEAELSDLEPTEQAAYLKELGVEKSGLERLIQKAFSTLGLMTFLTAGEKEVRAWTIKKESTAPEAAGVIHTDFEKGFIKAAVVSFSNFVEYGGWKKCMELGKVRQEGRDYVMQDGDVVEFKFSV